MLSAAPRPCLCTQRCQFLDVNEYIYCRLVRRPQQSFVVTHQVSTCRSFDSRLNTKGSWIRDTCSSFLLYVVFEMLGTEKEEVRSKETKRRRVQGSTEADFLSCQLHLSFYGQQQGPSLPLMALTAYLTLLHSLSLLFSSFSTAKVKSGSVATGSGLMSFT